MSVERLACQADIVDTIEAVAALEPEWSALERLTPEATGFQSFRWCGAWLTAASCRNTDCRARVLCIRENGRLVMLWPLQIESRLGVRIARWIGEPMTQYGDALAERGEGRDRWRKAAEEEMARWRDVDLFAFARLRADGVLAPMTPTTSESLSAPFVDLRARDLRRHKSLDRRARRLDAIGPTALVEAQTPAEREELTRRAFALKRDWLRRKGLISVGLSDPLSEHFVVALAREGFLRVHALRVGENIAALELGFVAGGAYRSLLGCFDARFAEGSPGQTLTRRLIARCVEEGLEGYDLLLPADAYKLMWATDAMSVQAQFLAVTLKGRTAAFALARVRPVAKRALYALGALRAGLRARMFSFFGVSATVPPSTGKGRPL